MLDVFEKKTTTKQNKNNYIRQNPTTGSNKNKVRWIDSLKEEEIKKQIRLTYVVSFPVVALRRNVGKRWFFFFGYQELNIIHLLDDSWRNPSIHCENAMNYGLIILSWEIPDSWGQTDR